MARGGGRRGDSDGTPGRDQEGRATAVVGGDEASSTSTDPRLTAALESDSRLLVSSFFTLTLAILGSSVLPVPYAWSRAGLVPGLAIMVVVAAANACACRLLMAAAEETGHDTYDGVAGEAGGPLLKSVTQASLVLLLFGTVCGDIALLAEVAPRSLARLFPPAAAANAALAAAAAAPGFLREHQHRLWSHRRLLLRQIPLPGG